jgi:hypothetical protein
MKRLRIDYMLAAGDPQRRYAINREFIALAFEMKAAGASRADIMTIGQATLCHAKRESPGCARWHENAAEKTLVTFGSGSQQAVSGLPVGSKLAASKEGEPCRLMEFSCCRVHRSPGCSKPVESCG